MGQVEAVDRDVIRFRICFGERSLGLGEGQEVRDSKGCLWVSSLYLWRRKCPCSPLPSLQPGAHQPEPKEGILLFCLHSKNKE